MLQRNKWVQALPVLDKNEIKTFRVHNQTFNVWEPHLERSSERPRELESCDGLTGTNIHKKPTILTLTDRF